MFLSSTPGTTPDSMKSCGVRMASQAMMISLFADKLNTVSFLAREENFSCKGIDDDLDTLVLDAIRLTH